MVGTFLQQDTEMYKFRSEAGRMPLQLFCQRRHLFRQILMEGIFYIPVGDLHFHNVHLAAGLLTGNEVRKRKIPETVRSESQFPAREKILLRFGS